MKGAFRIATFFGIPVELHWTFGLLLLWVVLTGLNMGHAWPDLVWNLLFVLALFGCVVLHEFGHALTARKFGVNTRDIILSPIGGIARLDRLPEKPVHEFYVAAAGPMVNVGIAVVLSPYFLLFPQPNLIGNLLSGRIFQYGLEFIPALILLNIILAVFNLLPAFPMDGGRILRSLLSIKLGRTQATRIATYIGQALAVLLVLFGFLEGSLITSFIGVFVFMTAHQEFQSVKVEAILKNHTVASVARTFYTRLYPSDSLFSAVRHFRQGLEKNFLVVDDWGRPAGSVSDKILFEALKKDRLDTRVWDAMVPDPEFLLPDETLAAAYDKLYQSEHKILPVMDKGTLLGVVDTALINDFLKMERKLKRRPSASDVAA